MVRIRITIAALAGLVGSSVFSPAAVTSPQDSVSRNVVNQYCAGCHNQKLKIGALALDKLDPEHVDANRDVWEKVVRKVRAGMMPPAGAPRPDRATLDAFAARVSQKLDAVALASPNPGVTALHRLNRAEYANAVRDLLKVEVDPSSLLPSDDSSEGFDNVAEALGVSPALLERYVSAATKISRLAVGDPGITAVTATYRAPGDLSQTEHIEGLPLGTRGGFTFRHTFPLDAEYAFKVKARGASIGVGAVGGPEDELEVTLDGARLKVMKAVGAPDLKIPIPAGLHTVGVALIRKNNVGADDVWSVYANNAGVQSVAITGPINQSGAGDTASRRQIFVCRPSTEAEELPCARNILSTLAKRAFRHPVSESEMETLLSFYQSGRNSAGKAAFEHGVEAGLARILIDPSFVFRFETEPESAAAGKPYRISDLELASRLSFFLWSSIPDDELLNLAIQGKLHDPAVLQHQTKRMLADPRSESLVQNFAGQWLYLRELKSARPETRDFNDNLRQSFRRETEMLFESIIREDRPVLDLLNADYTFVDERLARHYGIPGVYGSRFRRVTLKDDDRRGLLGQGSILLVTSVATRTSPVARGKWILENILGTSAPLPPPNVPALVETAGAQKVQSVRERMEAHRNNPVCASCHKIMDPIGFSMERFDLIGKSRNTDNGVPIDSTGQLVDGTKLDGPASLRNALLSRSHVFCSTLTEKLLTYAVGRGLKYYDMPAVRAIDKAAAPSNYRFSSLVVGIVSSPPFQMRMKTAADVRPGEATASLR